MKKVELFKSEQELEEINRRLEEKLWEVIRKLDVARRESWIKSKSIYLD